MHCERCLYMTLLSFNKGNNEVVPVFFFSLSMLISYLIEPNIIQYTLVGSLLWPGTVDN